MASARYEEAFKLFKKFPNTSQRSLARKLYDSNKVLFRDLEDARWVVRNMIGKTGKTPVSDRYKVKDYKGLQLPAGEKNDYGGVDVKGTNIGFMCDIHIPYHDLEAVNTAFKSLVDSGIDTLIIGGDLLDCYQLSRFEKDPRKRTFKYEIDVAKKFFEEVRKVFSGDIVFLAGNHDERAEAFFRQKAPELLDIEALTLPALLELDKFKVKYVSGKKYLKLGKLKVLHGHEYGNAISPPVNPARGLYLKTKSSSICGHHHQTSSHTETDIEGNTTGTWSVGALCDLHPDYRPLNKWNLGFARIEVFKGGNFKVHNYTIINGNVA